MVGAQEPAFGEPEDEVDGRQAERGVAPAMSQLPARLAIKFRAVPLMVDGRRLILAVDSPARVNDLKNLRKVQDIDYVAVLAPKLQILRKLDQLQADDWSDHVPKNLDRGFNSTQI
jgi:hypothetical protein